MLIVAMSKGINIGFIKIPSISNIKTASEELDKNISDATTITSISYPNKKAELDKSIKSLATEKQTYNDMIVYSSEEEVKSAKQFETYKIEFIWVKLGIYAKNENLHGKFELTESSNGIPDVKDIKFTLTGAYRNIIEFLYNVENDEKFNFKIEDFDISGSGKTVDATFIVKDVTVTL